MTAEAGASARRWEAGLDVVVVLTLAGQAWLDPAAVATGGGIVTMTVALTAAALRRRFPFAAVLTGAANSVSAGLLTDRLSLTVWILAQVCLFSVPLRRSPKATVATGVILAVSLLTNEMMRLDNAILDPLSMALIGWTAAIAGAGLTLRAHNDYLTAAHDQAAAAIAARDSEAARRVSDERLRIARDLHDAVAHNITVISLHAGAAERALDGYNPPARESLRHVREASRTVLSEMQSILRVLRTPAGTGEQDSVVTAAAISGLVDGFRRLGADIRVDDGARLDGLDPAADVAVYRLLQEALTNAQRHGHGPIDITVTRTGGELHLTVANRARPVTDPRARPGFGLIGMRERLASADGHLHIEQADGRFVLTASLPLAGTPYEEPR
jgi:signal transduction histidine kinase